MQAERAAPSATLQDLARAQIRRKARDFGYDWDAFVSSDPYWSITEIVHRRAVEQEHDRGLDVRPTDIATDMVLMAVRDVIVDWTEQPELRPTGDAFRQEQARRGEKGRETQQARVAPRNAQVMALVAAGVSDAEISRRVGLHRSQVGRIRRKADAHPPAAPGAPVAAAVVPFPAEDVPTAERWPATQFMNQTGIALDDDQARWLCDMGRCYVAEGREGELMDAIMSSARPGIRDPLAYLQRCVDNRGDASTVTAQLLADVLVWAGQRRLQYALTAIGGGGVRRPVAYLRQTLLNAVADGEQPSGRPERPVAMAVDMAREWASMLMVVDADDAVAAEDTDMRSGHVESFRRRFGRLPWEPEPVSDRDTADMDGCCTSLNGAPGDELESLDSITGKIDSSPGTSKADATRPVDGPDGGDGDDQWPALVEPGKLEHRPDGAHVGDFDENRGSPDHGGALQTADPTPGLRPWGNRAGFLEQGPCRHPLAMMLSTEMVLARIVQIECAAGCGHRLYSDRGPLECPCHWPTAKAAQVARALQPERTRRASAGDNSGDNTIGQRSGTPAPAGGFG